MDVKDFNVLIGPNNSGKTSVLQTLALLKQSTTQLAFQGPLINIGNFKEAVFNHDLRKNIGISFWLSFEKPINRKIKGLDQASPFSKFGGGRRIHCVMTIDGTSDWSPVISRTSLSDSSGRYIAYLLRDWRKKPLPGLENLQFSLQGFLPFLSSGESRIVEAFGRIRELVSEEFSKYLHYISSKRGSSSRSEGVDRRFSRRPDSVGVNGEDVVPVLAYIKDDASYGEVVGKINLWLEKFGLTRAAANIVDGPAYSLKLTNKKTRVQSSILDIGFGVNQLLPVIVQCFYAPMGSLIMIEQPEAHLHPRAQANVTDFLIDVVDSGNRVIVETHSEHLLLRLQRRVAEGRIDPSRVNICYFDQTSEQTKKKDIRIDCKGYFIKPIPEGFFEEGFQEALAHLKAAGSSSD